MSTESEPLLTVACTECNDAYAVLALRAEHAANLLCRRCRTVHFGEAVEELLTEGPYGAEEVDPNASQEERDAVLMRNMGLLVMQLQELRDLHLGT